jgi:arylsulfatase
LGAETDEIDQTQSRGPGSHCHKIDGKEVEVVANVQGLEVGPGIVPLEFTSNEYLDIGPDLGSSVSVNYYHQAPFTFDGKIETVHVQNIK